MTTAPADTALPGRRSTVAVRSGGLRAALLGYLAVRLVGLLVLAVWTQAHGEPLVARLGNLWDAHWYLDLARHGYDAALPPPAADGQRYSNLAFFPLYPALIRAVHTVLPLSTASSAVLVSWAAALAAAWGIFAAVAERHGPRVGVCTVLLWGALPHAVVMNVAYTEALFTALAAWALWATLTRRWICAGLLSTLSCLTRPTGIAVAAAVCAAAAVEVVQLRGGRSVSRPLAGAVLAPLGWFGYIAWVGARLGHWDGYFTVQLAWDSHFDFGRTTAVEVGKVLRDPLHSGATQAVVAAVLLASVGLFALSLRERRSGPLLVFAAVMLVITLGDAGAILSRARFLTPVFPLLVPAASTLARSRPRTAVLAVGAATAASAAYGLFLVCISASSL